jgi:hypothetical protein
MSYRRNARSYRRSVARYYQVFEDRPRARLGVIAGTLVAVLGVVAGMLISSHSGAKLATTSDAANGTACVSSSATPGTTTPAAADSASATPSDSAAPAVSATTSAAVTAAQLPGRRWRHRPPPRTITPTPPASAMPSASDTTTSTAAPTPSTTVTASASPSACTTPTPSASASTTPPAAAANVNCDIVVPANPLSAAGLATPWQLTGADGMTPAESGCTMANASALGAFVQATILNPVTGALSVYEPLVITQGTTPAVAPVTPTLPAGAIVTIDVGFNGTDLTQVGATPNALQQGNCVDGLDGSVFGQVSFCNGPEFFRAAARAELRGQLTIPPAGTSPMTGQPCPTTRGFDVIDQDPSDNVTTIYLLTASGQTAQLNTANTAALPGATKLVNGSDNALLTDFLDPTLGCTPFEAPDLSQGGVTSTSQALNELAAAKDQTAPIALIPENDEMVLVNDDFSIQKTDLYRAQIGQPPVNRRSITDTPANFCQEMENVQTPFLAANQAVLATDASPVPAVGNNLFTFLANRLSMSFANLNCQNYGLTDSVTVTLDDNGVARAATFNTAQQTATTNTGPGGGSPTPPRHRRGRHGHGLDNPSGE